jgi:hypothetical protein
MYVGITRATKWVYLSTIQRQGIAALDRLRRLAGTEDAPIVLQSWDQNGSSTAATIGPTGGSRKDPGEEGSDDLLDLI